MLHCMLNVEAHMTPQVTFTPQHLHHQDVKVNLFILWILPIASYFQKITTVINKGRLHSRQVSAGALKFASIFFKFYIKTGKKIQL